MSTKRQDIWTEEDLSALEEMWFKPAASAPDMARKLGRTAGAVNSISRRLRDRLPKLTDLRKERLRKYSERGLSRKQVAKLERMSVGSVGRAYISAGLTPPEPIKTGPKKATGYTSVNAFTDIEGLRALAEKGKTATQIALEMNFSIGTIRRHARAHRIRIATSPALIQRNPSRGTPRGQGHYIRADDGSFLGLSGENLTTDKNYAYKATLAQAERMADRLDFPVCIIPENYINLGLNGREVL